MEHENSYVLFESSFLELELMSAENADFALKEFKHILQLEEAESSWESNPEWLSYFNKRPIGTKPIKTKLLSIHLKDFLALLQSCGLNRFDKIEIRRNRLGDYFKEIKDCFGFGNSNYGIFFTVEYEFINQVWIVIEDISKSDKRKLTETLHIIETHYKLILVDWIEKRIVNLGNRKAIEIYLTELEE